MRTAWFPFFLLVLLSSCCPGRKIASEMMHTDSVRHVHREVRADTLSRIITAEHTVHNLTEAEIVTETVIYDTSKADSTGAAPVLERRRTTSTLRSNTTGTHTSTTEEDSVAVMELTTATDSVSNATHTHHEQRESAAQQFCSITIASIVVGVVFCGVAIVLVLVLRRWTS